MNNIPAFQDDPPVNIFDEIGCMNKDFVSTLKKYQRISFRHGLFYLSIAKKNVTVNILSLQNILVIIQTK